MKTRLPLFCLPLLVLAAPLSALEKPDHTYQVFQFPADRIPRIDGDAADWAMVPESYVVILDVTGPAGTSRRSKVWEVQRK